MKLNKELKFQKKTLPSVSEKGFVKNLYISISLGHTIVHTKPPPKVWSCVCNVIICSSGIFHKYGCKYITLFSIVKSKHGEKELKRANNQC